MLKHLFRAERKANRAIADALYDEIVATARQSGPYSHWNVPDTPLGRFEMLSVVMFLFLHRIKGQGKAADALGQELADAFFLDVDHSLRELGISDMGVPKRMKKLTRMFYGRVTHYEAALDARDLAALQAALGRNIRPDDEIWPESAELAAYVVEVADALNAQDIDRILSGRVAFPPVAVEEAGQ